MLFRSITVKITEKSNVFAVKAQLEAQLGTPALSGEVKGAVDLDKATNNTGTETTICE